MLAHVGDLAADPGDEVADRELADGERLEDAQPLRVRQRTTDAAYRSSIGLGRDREGNPTSPTNHVTTCANTQVLTIGRQSDRVGACAYSADDDVDRHRDARARSSPPASAIARPRPSDAAPVVARPPPGSSRPRRRSALADGRLYLKAEHLQKTGSFKAARDDATGSPRLTTPDAARGVDHAVGRQRRARRTRGPAGAPGCRSPVVMPAGADPIEGRGLPRLRRRGRPPRRARRRDVRRDGARSATSAA